MGPFLPFIIVFLIIVIVLLCLGVGIGFLLHWILPSVDFGMAILIGLIASAFSIQVLTGLNTPASDEDEEPEDNEKGMERIYLVEPPIMRRRKKKRTSRQ